MTVVSKVVPFDSGFQTFTVISATLCFDFLIKALHIINKTAIHFHYRHCSIVLSIMLDCVQNYEHGSEIHAICFSLGRL